MARHQSLAEQIAELDGPAPKDIDPETELDLGSTDNNESASDDERKLGEREHYQAVGKSKLRRRDEVSLGPQYAGARISRNQLDDIDSDSESQSGASGAESGSENGSGQDLGLDVQAAIDSDEGDDEEIDSVEAFGEGDLERFKNFTFRGSGNAQDDSSEESGSEDVEKDEESERPRYGSPIVDDSDENIQSDSEVDEGMIDNPSSAESSVSDLGSDSSDGSDESDSDTSPPTSKRANDTQRSKLQQLMNNTEATVTSSLSHALESDISKGRAIASQRQTFDQLLNARIRLQKGLIAFNTLPLAEEVSSPSSPPPETESALLDLWTTLDDLRLSLLPPSNPLKRKRPFTPNPNTPLSTLWTHMTSHETVQAPHRNSILDKWATNLRPTPANQSRLLSTSTTQPRLPAPSYRAPSRLSAVLTNTLDTRSAELIDRTKQPRACAPIQLERARPKQRRRLNGSKGVRLGSDSDMDEDGEDDERSIFDDADFYQQLLRELIEQRSSASAAINGGGGVDGAPGVQGLQAMQVVPMARKEAKTRRGKEARVSKDRRMRFAVHEKLVDFMVREDRGVWDGGRRGELFGGLFGRKGGLREEGEKDEGGEGGDDHEEEIESGLRLFASNEEG
ncbi:MAG: rRNA-processing protein bfr2 [Vezdaea aestivalis]|nr:MAG: rRNA-processing protein bfr2 [Vezdaea aestivalis]